MKINLAILSAAFLVSNSLLAQNNPPPGEKVYEIYDLTKEPSFPGGLTEMYKYISRNLPAPDISKDSILGGKLILSFVVETSGILTDIHVIKEISRGSGEEAVKIIKSMPAWIPGEIGGQKVRAKYVLPMYICFR